MMSTAEATSSLLPNKSSPLAPLTEDYLNAVLQRDLQPKTHRRYADVIERLKVETGRISAGILGRGARANDPGYGLFDVCRLIDLINAV